MTYLIGRLRENCYKLKIYRLASNETILGLTQLDSKISQDEGIANEIEKLNVTGAKVTKNMMVIPINNTTIIKIIIAILSNILSPIFQDFRIYHQ